MARWAVLMILCAAAVGLFTGNSPADTAAAPPPPPPSEAAAPPPPPPPEAVHPGEHAGLSHKTEKAHTGGTEAFAGSAESKLTPGEVFRVPFMRRALITGVLVGAICGFLGLYVILKRVVFLGIALAEVSSAGVAMGLALGVNPFVGSIALMLAGVILFSVRWSPKRIPQDAFIGIGFAIASAAAVLLVATSPKGESHMLDIIFGNILTVTNTDVWVTAAGFAVVAAVHLLFAKEFLFTSADPETAAAFGYDSRRWELMLYATVGLTIALAIHVSGVLMTFASLVIPAATALLLSQRLAKCGVLAVVLGAVVAPVGLYVSFVRNLPSSATIVVLSAGILVAAGIARVTARLVRA